jgi:hypothetical protein
MTAALPFFTASSVPKKYSDPGVRTHALRPRAFAVLKK